MAYVNGQLTKQMMEVHRNNVLQQQMTYMQFMHDDLGEPPPPEPFSIDETVAQMLKDDLEYEAYCEEDW